MSTHFEIIKFNMVKDVVAVVGKDLASVFPNYRAPRVRPAGGDAYPIDGDAASIVESLAEQVLPDVIMSAANKEIIAAIFKRHRDLEMMRVEVVQYMTLFLDDRITEGAFGFLRQLVRRDADIAEMLRSFDFQMLGDGAIMQRIGRVVISNILKYFHEWNRTDELSSLDSKGEFIKECAQSLICMLLYRSTRYETEVDMSYAFDGGEVAEMKASEDDAAGLNYQDWEFDSYHQYLPPHFGGTEANILRTTALTTFYFPRACHVSLVPTVRILVSELVVSVCDFVLLDGDEIRAWDLLTSPERYYVNCMLKLCASLCTGHHELVKHCLQPHMFAIAVAYEAHCPYSVQIIEAVLSFCFVTPNQLPENFIHTSIANMLMDEELNLDVKDKLSKALAGTAVIRSIVSNRRNSDLCADCISDLFEMVSGQGTTATRRCVVFNSPLDNSDMSVLWYKLHVQFLMLLRVVVDIEEHDNTMFRDTVPHEFCMEVLQSRGGSLQVKSIVTRLFYSLHVRHDINRSRQQESTTALLQAICVEMKRICHNCRAHRHAMGGFEYVSAALVSYLSEACYVISESSGLNSLLDGVQAMLSSWSVHRSSVAASVSQVYGGLFLSSTTDMDATFSGVDMSAMLDCDTENLFDCVSVLCQLLKALHDEVGVISEVISHEIDYNCFAIVIFSTMLLYRNVNAEFLRSGQVRTQVEHFASTLDLLIKLRDSKLEETTAGDFLVTEGLPAFTAHVANLVDNRRSASSRSRSNEVDVINDLGYHADVRSDDPMHLWVKESFMGYLSTAARMLVSAVDGDIEEIFSGKMAENTILRSTDFVSEFDIWSMGGGRYLCGMIRFLERHNVDNVESLDVPKFMLHLLCSLLSNNIYLMTKHTWEEVDRVRALQMVLSRMGLPQLVVALVSAGANLPYGHDYTQQVLPVVLKLGIRAMVGGNEVIQEAVMSTHLVGLQSRGPFRSMYGKFAECIDALLQLTTHKTHVANSSHIGMDALKIGVMLCNFCGSLCSGHNLSAQNFLRDQNGAGRNVNIVLRISKFVEALQQQLCNQMFYISYDQFYNVLAPCVWRTEPFVKRRFIAWHDRRADYQYMCTLMTSLQFCFMSLSQLLHGPNMENQPSALSPVVLCANILEYLGSMHLQIPLPHTKTRSLRRARKAEKMHSSRPREFLKRYRRVLGEMELYLTDPDSSRIDEVLDRCRSDSEILQGMEKEQFFEIANKLERACLRYVLALLEASSDLAIDTVLAALKGEILMQNMDNMYKLSFVEASLQKRGGGKMKTTAVSYVTLISTLAYGREDNPLVVLDDLLRQWLEDTARDGFPTDTFISSVEIVSKDSRVQTIYFPIPDEVLRFWQFTEVKRAKEFVLQNVNRESPEDKIMSFYYLMKGIEHVMHRHGVMRRVLSPVLHHMLGGTKPILAKSNLLELRPHLHLATVVLCFNITMKEYMTQNAWFKNDVAIMR